LNCEKTTTSSRFFDGGAYLRELRELAAPIGPELRLAQILAGVVAYPLELHDAGQRQAAPRRAAGVVQQFRKLIGQLLVQHELLFGESGKLLELNLLRKIANDRLVGLGAARDEGRRHGAQAGRAAAVVAQRRLEAGKLTGRTQQALVEKVEYRPEIAQAVLDGRISQRDAVGRRQCFYGARLSGLRVFDGLRLVGDKRVPLRGLKRIQP
jgi:hypothetical protein